MNQQVSIVMGSDSDLSIMSKSAAVLEDFHVRYEVKICSAHRSPKETHMFASSLEKRGIKVVIAGAGGAAHLAGVIASYVSCPVIGIPMQSTYLAGVDSLLSVVQMPSGVPVATVGINAAENAALLAIQILAVSDKKLQFQLVEYKKKLAKGVLVKSEKLQRVGYKKYLQSNL
ncbi:MAG: 5-(carboxyamino)imidazole ribonucleotide mutase [Candidatus Gottesmanbacteria bacterium]|nr:5-(carboxyamino)imidazole ribonucleotide mutase [Candidatus Gottesmanbacteria bacterium]